MLQTEGIRGLSRGLHATIWRDTPTYGKDSNLLSHQREEGCLRLKQLIFFNKSNKFIELS